MSERSTAVRAARRGLAASLLPVLLVLQGCVYLPVTKTRPDPDCQGVRREVVLEAAVIGQLGACANRGCEAMLAAAAVVSAASFVVSGSVAVVGNVVYWVERQAACRKPGDPA